MKRDEGTKLTLWGVLGEIRNHGFKVGVEMLTGTSYVGDVVSVDRSGVRLALDGGGRAFLPLDAMVAVTELTIEASETETN